MTGTWPQPFEGIRGAESRAWLLSLDEKAVLHRELLISMARHLRTATMVGSPAPVARRIGERMRSPETGDLVATVEVMHGRGDEDYRLKGFGLYLGGRREWAETDEEWAACRAAETIGVPDLSDTDRATDTVFYIQYGQAAGDICRWHNSEAVVLPVLDGEFVIDAAAERTADRAVFTRDSLVASLADSGFVLRGEPRPVPDESEADLLVTIRTLTGEITGVSDVTAHVTTRVDRHG
jgi:hypothetical protein